MTNMPSIIECPACGRQLSLPEELLGKAVRCPNCNETFTSSTPEGQSPEPIPSQGFGSPDKRDEPPVDSQFSRKPLEEDDDFKGGLDDYDESRPRRGRSRSPAKSAVAGPAIALMIVGGLGLAIAIVNLVITLVNPDVNQLFPAPKNDAEKAGRMMGNAIGGIVSIGWGIVVIAASIQMLNLRTRGFAFAGAIVAMIPCNLCCLLGLPFGIWALVVLSRDDVKNAFQ
jgi:hypothetical protein